MKISDAIALRHDGSIPGTSYDYHVVVAEEEEIEISATESIKRPKVCLLRWWDGEATALERRFELDHDSTGEYVPGVDWLPGVDDPSGPVARFVREVWAEEYGLGGDA